MTSDISTSTSGPSYCQPCPLPRRSPKTGQWWSPENRPMRRWSGHYSDEGDSLRQREQCLERREEETSDRVGQLGWALRRIEKETGVRGETAAGYMKSAGISVRSAGGWADVSRHLQNRPMR